MNVPPSMLGGMWGVGAGGAVGGTGQPPALGMGQCHAGRGYNKTLLHWDANVRGMFKEQGTRRRWHLPWEGVGCWLMPCPSWSVSQSCMRMKGSRPFCVSLLQGLGRDSMSLTLPWDRPSTWARRRRYLMGCCHRPHRMGQGALAMQG